MIVDDHCLWEQTAVRELSFTLCNHSPQCWETDKDLGGGVPVTSHPGCHKSNVNTDGEIREMSELTHCDH